VSRPSGTLAYGAGLPIGCRGGDVTTTADRPPRQRCRRAGPSQRRSSHQPTNQQRPL